jgi:hypothetical protein
MRLRCVNGQRSLFLCLFLLVAVIVASSVSASASGDKVAQGKKPWSAEGAWKWYKGQPWLVGFNYIPASAINTTEMWQKETFDPVTIDREMALAQSIGLNCARVFVQYLVWENDPEGLKGRMDTFLGIAAKHGIKTMWVLFDDCAFGTMTEPFLGKQPDVIPGEYANGWTPSPGPSRVVNRKAWPKLEAYVTDLISRFRSDQRVLAWDVYNEPGNTNMGNKSLPLLQSVFLWARQAAPRQPLTAGFWSDDLEEINRTIFANSDVVSFHIYAGPDATRRKIVELQKRGRPLLCTEWMNRPLGSTFAAILPIFYQNRVGSMFWGLVNGKTQTNYTWGSKAGTPPPKVWQCDLFRGDFTPYDSNEIELLKYYIRAARGSAR